ncbi:MAG: hypothetical protein IPO88_01410 [Nannocystis sp.]|uniref:hypothetical protein n=1 Tax=Nannocystis sp. TaxID=1962667 RepID=UPI002427B3B8|nr:hypothetical protein [Nannocystis sp.]MBK9752160.1 hypothetical protein [Nannocystis sp.]
MPKLPHEALVQLVRCAPEMVVDLLQRELAPGLPLHLPPRVTAAEFVDLNLAEYRADAVLMLGDPERPSEVIVVEVQSEIDARKRRVWPIYVAGPRVRLGCPVVLVVIAPDPQVAAWCAEPIDLGRGCNVLRPMVLGPDQIPVITDHEVARRSPELAVLSVAAHGRELGAEHIALAAIAASHDLDNDRDLLYPDFILALLGDLARAALEKIVMQARNYEFQSDFVRKYFYGGKAEGLTEGKAAGKAEVLLKLLRRKFTAVDAAYEARVLACSDVDQLDAWAERVLDADSVAAVFAA